ncbi:hypothetical protein CYCD_03560 [Tenuifilaceae bacterium CYCD]|nr:hypothetical protein CYCD_03560 [Tenuifilaceae bacterium CYCD]
MKHLLLMVSMAFCIVACKNQCHKVEKVLADELVLNTDQFCGKKVETEGVIVHICGVDGKKMKLKADNGSMLMISASEAIPYFDKKFFNKRVRIQGLVWESRVDSLYLDKVEVGKTLLCHINNSPCKDTVWVKKQTEYGREDSLSQRDVKRLRDRMKQTGKQYVSTVIICAENVDIIEKED